MRPVTMTRAVTAGILLAVALFCAFGVLATFEPNPNAMVFRIGYAAVGVAAVAISIWLLFLRK